MFIRLVSIFSLQRNAVLLGLAGLCIQRVLLVLELYTIPKKGYGVACGLGGLMCMVLLSG